MEKKEVAIGNPLTVAGVTLIPISEVTLNCSPSEGGFALLATKHPLGIVVISPSDKRAFRITGEQVPLDEFIHEFPEIKEVV